MSNFAKAEEFIGGKKIVLRSFEVKTAEEANSKFANKEGNVFVLTFEDPEKNFAERCLNSTSYSFPDDLSNSAVKNFGTADIPPDTDVVLYAKVEEFLLRNGNVAKRYRWEIKKQ